MSEQITFTDIPHWLRSARLLFDRRFYETTYPHVCTEGTEPLDEYLSTGWKDGRDPSPRFNTSFYLEQYPDVRASGECPLIHYARCGAAEGRIPRPYPPTSEIQKSKSVVGPGSSKLREPAVDCLVQSGSSLSEPQLGDSLRRAQLALRRSVVNAAVSPRERALHWPNRVDGPLSVSDDVRKLLDEHRSSRPSGLILSFSHDDATVVEGGVQMCVRNEQSVLVSEGWTYVHVHPARPLPFLSDDDSTSRFLVRARVNGISAGTLALDDLLEALVYEKRFHPHLHVIVHHFLGFAPERVVEAVARLKPKEVLAWQHDFFSLCPSPPLLRNDVEFCNGPPLDSAACSVCVYGEERKLHLKRIIAAFDKIRPTVLSPSETAASFWKARQTHPHQAVKMMPLGVVSLVPRRESTASNVFRVAFLGIPIYHKGWHLFEALASQLQDDPRYEFYQLGVLPVDGLPKNIKHIDVSGVGPDRASMTEAVFENQIDVVINWSLCYETFSYTAHEALAGGAYVIARNGSGNIWPAVKNVSPERGCAVGTETALIELFLSGKIFDLAQARRPGSFKIGNASADYLLSERSAAG